MAQPNTLWRQPDFLKVWFGQTVSALGSQISVLALPLTAAVLLHASPFEMGVLEAVQYVPFLVLGLIAGVWVDRLRRRPIMIMADGGRAVLLALLPLAALSNVLVMWQLYVVAGLVGALTLFFDVAYSSYLPSLVGRDQLVDGNSKFELTRSAAQLVSPGIGGILIQLLTAPVAIVVDAASFVVSAVSLVLVRSRERVVASPEGNSSVWVEMRHGLSMLMRDGVLRPILFTSVAVTLFSNVSVAVYVLYLTRELAILPAGLGVISIFAGIGALPGAVLGRWISDRMGIGPTLILALVGVACGELLVPLASGPRVIVLGTLMLSQAIVGGAFVIWNINQLSLRQACTPDHLLGRVNAAYRFLVWGVIPVGALVGGTLGTAIGLRPTLFVSAFGVLLGPLWILASPARSLRTASSPEPQTETEQIQPEPDFRPGKLQPSSAAQTRMRAGVCILTALADGGHTGQVLFHKGAHSGGLLLSSGNLQAAWFDTLHGLPAVDALVLAMLDRYSVSVQPDSAISGKPLLDQSVMPSYLEQCVEDIEAMLTTVPFVALPPARSSGDDELTMLVGRDVLRTLLAVDGKRTIADLVDGAGTMETIHHIGNLVEAGLVRV